MAVFSFPFGGMLVADDDLFEEVTVEENAASPEEENKPPKRAIFPVKVDAQEQKSESPKKLKPQYAGARRTPDKPKDHNKPKKPARIKNEWFTSKTHPKMEKKEPAEIEEAPAELPDDRPYFTKTSYSPPVSRGPLFSFNQQPARQEESEEYLTAEFQAPRSHFYLTAEWLYWRTRQGGMEFATSKRIDFDFQSGFRVGLGVHLPYDHWDIYVNYTRFVPDASASVHGSFYPLFLFQGTHGPHGTHVSKAHAHWKVEFQTADVEIGRVYYVGNTFVVRPFFGLKGAWIDQDAKVSYEGGFIPHGQSYRTKFDNDFKGGGPLIGVESNWLIGEGFSLFGDFSAAPVIGYFFNQQKQFQLHGAKVVDLNTDSHLVSPILQVTAGLAWDRNFRRDRMHIGVSAGFEAQYWWEQNQIEQFTDDDLPIYVREKGDLSFYGLTLRGRFDF